jgi:TPR repeat protein
VVVRHRRVASVQGDANVQNNLGVAYEKGHSVNQSDSEAVMLIRKAADQGYEPAKKFLTTLR